MNKLTLFHGVVLRRKNFFYFLLFMFFYSKRKRDRERANKVET